MISSPFILSSVAQEDGLVFRLDNSEQGLLMATSKSERKTENIVRDDLRRLGYFREGSKIVVEEQRSEIAAVKKLMKAASKSGHGGIGSPEFIISSPENADFLVIVECKASVADHVSSACKVALAGQDPDENGEDYVKRVQKFGVDGVLHYAGKLAKEFNVVAIAISGETKDESIVSTFLHAKGADRAKILQTKDGGILSELIRWGDYIEHGTFDPAVQHLRSDELMAFSRELHDFMRDHAKLTESEKPLMASGTLIALRNKPFAKSFDEYIPSELQDAWFDVISKEIRKADIPQAKKDKMVQPYSTIAAHPELGKATRAYPKGVLHELIKRLNEKVWPFISIYHDFDVVGQFYGEFLKYTGGDKKALGIVLTPRHITELFSLLANVDKNSRVLDIYAGTGGFLISAMYQMMRTAVTAKDKKRIERKGLVGVEQQPNMFALAASNMILRGDGKANLYQGSCFDDEIVAAVKAHKCTVGMLNPPFSQGDSELHELRFVKQMLDCLKKGSIGLALTPMSCAISPHPARGEILASHTLEAVMSLPSELFYPVGTIACAMVFTAKVSHALSDRETWFGYWKDDGFVKTKHRGRIDLHGKWSAIRDRWVSMFRNRQVIPGLSITKKVTAADEWLAEAYMEADYSQLTRADFDREVKRYIVFQILSEDVLSDESNDEGTE